jgi:Rrf2 family cysteine metabolism transcriptional repressor
MARYSNRYRVAFLEFFEESEMRITQWGEYATHFCIYFARHTSSIHSASRTSITATEIAKEHGIDQLYAQQILQRLRKGNLIKSIRGAQGGYQLSRPPAEITLKDILSAAEGETFEMICDSKPINETKCAPTGLCSLRDVWRDLKTEIDSFLESKRLSDLASKLPSQKDPLTQIGKKKVA